METIDIPGGRPVWQLDEEQLAAEARWFLMQSWKMIAAFEQRVAEIDSRGSADLYGYRSTAEWVQHVGRMTRSEAKKYVERAKVTQPGCRLDGTAVVPWAGLTGEAAAAGDIGQHHVARIIAVLQQVPDEVSEQDRVGGATILVDLARVAGPAELDKAGAEVLARLDPDGKPPKDEKPRRRPELRVRQRRDGWFDIDGQLDPTTGTRLVAALEPLARPRRDASDPVWGAKNTDLPAFTTPDERYGEAFAEFVQAAMGAPEISFSDRAHLLVTVHLDDLRNDLQGMSLDLATPLSAGEARRIACDCAITPAVLGSHSEPLDLGRTQRLITTAQRQALAHQDRGCAARDCH